MGGSKGHSIRPADAVGRDKEQGASTEIGNTTLTLSVIFKSLFKIADQATFSWAHPHKAEGTGALEAVGYGSETEITNVVPIGYYWRYEWPID
jgi:hypothetical protein